MKKTLVVYSPSKTTNEVWLPVFWSQSKTYYEKNGKNKDEWSWYPCYADIFLDDLVQTKKIISDAKPDIFAVSLYVWNANLALEVAKWVKETFPKCLVISGGPHQTFKHDLSWFKKHPYIDCSLPGENYGELCLAEILDNFSHDINFDKISNLRYPTKNGRNLCVSKKSLIDKKTFDYEWSSYADQIKEINDFIKYAASTKRSAKILSILETTRGCPYGCTYCDWGGGIATKVLKKPLEFVKRDIDYLCTLDIVFVYFADANFGIFGDRDIEIISYLADKRRFTNKHFKIGYGGFAKTESKLDAIKKIMEIDLSNDLNSHQEIKISMQSLHDDVLKNIDRKNISLEKQLSALRSLANGKKHPIWVEMILGLPGMDLHKFYQELDILGDQNLSTMWYEWLLLPETPAYSHEYRKKFGIKTILKRKGWSYTHPNNEYEIVVSSNNFTHFDYLEMLVATSWYHAIVRGGIFRRSLDWVKKQTNYGSGKIISFLLSESDVLDSLKHRWQQIMQDPDQPAVIDFDGNEVYLGYFVPAWIFFDTDDFINQTRIILNNLGIDSKLLDKDCKDLLNAVKYKQWQEINHEFYLYKNSGKIFSKPPIFKKLIDFVF